MLIKVGTRSSRLALKQANLVIEKLKLFYPDYQFQLVPIVTEGDLILDRNLYEIGGKALFIKKIEESLQQGRVDIAVHSLKDIPGILEEDFKIGAVLERIDPRDTFISKNFQSLLELPFGAIIGTSAPRRRVILKNLRPDLEVVDLRGNIDTRINKLLSVCGSDSGGQKKVMGKLDAIILANSGIRRLWKEINNGENNNLAKLYYTPLRVEEFLPAAGQGVIAIEIRKNDNIMQEICDRINHVPTWHLVKVERDFLAYLQADCKTPIAACARYYSNIDGREILQNTEITLKNEIFNNKDYSIKADFMLANVLGTKILYCSKDTNQINSNIGTIAAQELLYKNNI